MKNYTIKITGLVQGVGFRPFVYREATALRLNGVVENRNDGVYISVHASSTLLNTFIDNIQQHSPPAASIESVDVFETTSTLFKDFRIIESRSDSERITQVSPDIAVCEDCLRDMRIQDNRIDYPFVNCTNCGPRFTIIKELPYDRPSTTMAPFKMCNDCSIEYHEVSDRRFHAQPTACIHCGPTYSMYHHSEVISNLADILERIGQIIKEGGIIAVKGLGGYHLMCDALQESAVEKLRTVKNRDSKPFAILCKDLETVKQIADVSLEEEKLLTSWRRPIVLLKSLDKVAPSISNGLNNIGIMLPYLPFHHILFRYLPTHSVVLTSGNIADEPIVIDNKLALHIFSDKVNAIITNNRDIHNRCDDSVAMVLKGKDYLIRRSRGYAPSPILLNKHVEGILAVGAELTNCFAIGKGNQALLSQYIGDLKNAETYAFYQETYERFCKLFRFKPTCIASDYHPQYLSTQFAEKLAKEQCIPVFKIQHHHAHVAAVMAEHQLQEPVIGISFDGVGLGDDNSIWGGEFFIAEPKQYTRKYHFEAIPISGGNELPYEPWKSALAYGAHYCDNNMNEYLFQLMQGLNQQQLNNYKILLEKKWNTWKYSSAGRLFDAVAAITGICTKAGFHAEAPMRLESSVNKLTEKGYSFEVIDQSISFKTTFEQIVFDLQNNEPKGLVASKFHRTLVDVVLEISVRLKKETGLTKVVFSGGTFQNTVLLKGVLEILSMRGFECYVPEKIPVNDGGIALGQLYIASCLIKS